MQHSEREKYLDFTTSANFNTQNVKKSIENTVIFQYKTCSIA